MGDWGNNGATGRSGVISAYDDQNQWMTWKQRYDSAVSQFDGFSGQCDSIMNNFEIAKTNAANLWTQGNKFFEDIENAERDLVDYLNDAQRIVRDDLIRQQRAILQQFQEMFTQLDNEVNVYLY